MGFFGLDFIFSNISSMVFEMFVDVVFMENCGLVFNSIHDGFASVEEIST